MEMRQKLVTRLVSFRRSVLSKIDSKRNGNNNNNNDNTNDNNSSNSATANGRLMDKNNRANISSYGATMMSISMSTSMSMEGTGEATAPPPPSQPQPQSQSQSQLPPMTHFAIIAILSTSFSCTCLNATFFIVIAPIECQRIQTQTSDFYSDSNSNSNSHGINKSIVLAFFAAVMGVTQLIKPLIGLLSDCYGTMLERQYRRMYRSLNMMGRRMPYLILGTFMVVVGVCGMMWSRSPIHPIVVVSSSSSSSSLTTAANEYYHDANSNTERMLMEMESDSNNNSTNGGQVVMGGAWIQYTIFLFITMLGSNIVYTIMIVLIPDLVPKSQTGVANGTLALLVVSGALFGFFAFDVLQNNVMAMYKMYIATSSFAAMFTFVYVYERETTLKGVERNIAEKAFDTDNYYFDSNSIIEESGGEEKEEEPERIQAYTTKTTDFNNDSTITAVGQTNREHVTTSKEDKEDAERQENETDEASLLFPPLHTLIYILLYKPIMNKSRSEVIAAYWIDTLKHRDFFIVTISRFFYYMGVSSQTFFLYYIHDVLRQSARTANPEATIVLLAIVGQFSGAITCYPVGVLSDEYMGGQRKIFVYIACILLALGNIGLLLCKTLTQMIGVCALLGAANGVYLTMDTSLAVDTLDINEDGREDEDLSIYTSSIDFDEEVKVMLQQDTQKKVETHNHGAAQLLGVWGVFGFIGSALGPLIGGTALLILGKTTAYDSTTSASSATMLGSNLDTSDGGIPTTVNSIFPSAPFYKFQGYEALFSLSAFYFFCSALSLAFVRKKGV